MEKRERLLVRGWETDGEEKTRWREREIDKIEMEKRQRKIEKR